MDLRLSEEQELLQSTAREVLQRDFPMERVRRVENGNLGYEPEFWQRMARLGWLGTPFPEDRGGAGYGFLELCLLIEELGRFRVPSPLLSTVALGGQAIARFGSETQQARFLPDIANGECIVAHARAEPKRTHGPGGVGLSMGRDGTGFVLDGTLWLVPYAHVAHRLLVVAPTAPAGAGVTLLLVDARAPGISCEPMVTLGAERLCQVQLREVRVSDGDVLGQPDQQAAGDLIDEWGAAAHCAAMVGGAQRVLELSTAYATQRVQFGRPIGSFQAIQHHCANMAVDVATSRYIAYEAIWRLSENLDAAPEVSMAKAWVSDAYARVCALGHQVHGAIGFTHEHELRLYSEHAAGAALAFGDGDYHREAVCRHLGI